MNKKPELKQAFKVDFDPILGRHLVATKPIRAGEITFQEPPLIRGPFQHTIPVCLGCYKSLNASNSTPCVKCGWPLCSPECEQSIDHIPECTLTVAKGSKISIQNFGIIHPNYQSIVILRCLYQRDNAPEIWAKLSSLQGSDDTNETATVNFVRKFFKLEESFTNEEVINICGILKTNAHEVPLTQPPHIAIFETTSLFEHNCRANCCKSFTDDGNVLMVAAQDIAVGDHLSICYTDPLWGTLNRRRHLYETKNFWCQCSRCSDPTELGTGFSSMNCPDSDCGGYVLPKSFLEQSEWSCCKCLESVPLETVITVLGGIGKNLLQLPKGSVYDCKKFIKKYHLALPADHFFMVDIKIALVQIMELSKLDDDDLNFKLEMVEDLIKVVAKIAPAEHRLRGVLLFELGMIMIEIIKRKNGSEELTNFITRGKAYLIECCKLLKHEPNVMSEGKIYRKAKIELSQILKQHC